MDLKFTQHTHNKQVKRRTSWPSNIGCLDSDSTMYVCEHHFVKSNKNLKNVYRQTIKNNPFFTRKTKLHRRY